MLCENIIGSSSSTPLDHHKIPLVRYWKPSYSLVVREWMDCSTMESTSECSWSSVKFKWNLCFMLCTVAELLVKHGNCEPKSKNCMKISKININFSKAFIPALITSTSVVILSECFLAATSPWRMSILKYSNISLPWPPITCKTITLITILNFWT